MDDAAILALVTRLARPDHAGRQVIERAAIMAAGADGRAVVAWILDHDGKPEQSSSEPGRRGLHSPRPSEAAGTPQRFVLPAGVL